MGQVKAITKTDKTLADLRAELWGGTNELFREFFTSIAEQVEMTPDQQETVSGYLTGIEEKRDKLADFIKSLEEEAVRLREREKQIASRRQEYEKVASLFRHSVLVSLQNNPAGIVLRVDGLESSFRVKKNPPKVEITSQDDLPGEFINYQPQPDKRKIKDALDAGQDVPGARIAETTYTLEIR